MTRSFLLSQDLRLSGTLKLATCLQLPYSVAGVTHVLGDFLALTCYVTDEPSNFTASGSTSCSSDGVPGVQTWHSVLALSPLPAGDCLYEVSSGSVPGQASFHGPYRAGVCGSVSHSCWVLPAHRGAHLPGCFCGSHFTGRYILFISSLPRKMFQLGAQYLLGTCHSYQMLLFLKRSTVAKADCQ